MMMTVSELIERLTLLKEKHGDLPVLIEQQFQDCERMCIESVEGELTLFEDMDYEAAELAMENDLVNSIVLSDES